MTTKLMDVKAWKQARKGEGRNPDAAVMMTPRVEAPSVIEVKSERKNVDDVRAALRGIGAPEAEVERALDNVEAGDVIATYTMSTDTVDRPGDKIHQDGWDLEEYRSNPVMLFAHDASQPSIGMALGVYLQRGALRGSFKFTPESVYPFGATIGRLVKGGFMKAGSVGFAPIDAEVAKDRVDPENPMHDWFPPIDFKRQKLLEFSAVPIPANPEALVDARGLPSGDVRAVREWAERCLAGEGGKTLSLPREVVERLASVGKRSTIMVEVRRSDEGAVDVVAVPATEAKAEGEAAPETKADDLMCPACGHVGAADTFVPVDGDEEQPSPESGDDASAEGDPTTGPDLEEEGAAALPKAFDGWHAEIVRDPDALRRFVDEVTKTAVAKAMAQITGRLPD